MDLIFEIPYEKLGEIEKLLKDYEAEVIDKSFLEIFTADKGWFGLIEISGNYVREDRACGHAGPQRSAQTRVNPRRRFFRVD